MYISKKANRIGVNTAYGRISYDFRNQSIYLRGKNIGTYIDGNVKWNSQAIHNSIRQDLYSFIITWLRSIF